ncbi:hypothetical protein HRH25_12110 [Flavisolibacter sp. BT320]|nr:hypothetical protein [Flavisolibacter longurius]
MLQQATDHELAELEMMMLADESLAGICQEVLVGTNHSGNEGETEEAFERHLARMKNQNLFF